jgi:S1-C subfamily serine protease
MGKRTELVIFVSVLSLVFSMTMQGVVFDNNKVLTSALAYVRNSVEKSTKNNLEQSSIITQQSHYNTNEASLKNPALLSTTNTTKSTNLRTIFKQIENSVVQITSKLPTPTSNTLNPQSPNTTALGSGFVYDNQGHIITNGHVVGDAKIVDVTFVDGNRYTANVIGTDIYGDIAVLQI